MNKPELVGILNITPDSFSDGDLYTDQTKAMEHAEQLRLDGAAYIDVGAESTRPGARPLTADEEWARLEPILPDLIAEFRGQVSLDTYHPETVRRAALLGSFFINDVTGFNNPEMIETAADLGLTCIVSHLPQHFGQDIQRAHKEKPIDSVDQVRDELLARREQMIGRGILKSRMILDPGIGFGKTRDINWKLLEFAKLVPDSSVMVGYSRKGFLGKDRYELAPNLEAGKIAAAAGTHLLRVHDIAGHLPLTLY
jgi:dihydropteroate synthase